MKPIGAGKKAANKAAAKPTLDKGSSTDQSSGKEDSPDTVVAGRMS
jgi:hypothetical protein